MKLKFNITLTVMFTFVYACCFGQMSQYNYKRVLNGTKVEWCKIALPENLYSKVNTTLYDLRVFGINSKNDTIEAPYLLNIADEKIAKKEIAFNLINQSNNTKGYYFTFEIPVETEVNQMKPLFKDQNFDWRIKLEGSQNLQEWFSIIDHYRILSIKNEHTNFSFTDIIFPASKYRYYRLFFDSKNKPQLANTNILMVDSVKGKYINYNLYSLSNLDDKKNKITTIDINLPNAVPVCNLKFFITNPFDYYRSVTIKYQTDSFKTTQGWKYNYSELISGTLNSIQQNEFLFNSTILKKVKIIIDNGDNTPIKIDSVLIKGYVHELITHITEPANYYLVYGNHNIAAPNYDLEHFKEKIPTSIITLETGKEELIVKQNIQHKNPLFENKKWLWLIMIIIVAVLGIFTFKMMKHR